MTDLEDQLRAVVASFNWVDWAVLATVLVFALGGMSRGLILGVLDLFSLVVAYGVAVLGYQQAGTWLQSTVGVPPLLANPLAFIGLLVVGQLGYSLLVNVLSFVLRPALSLAGPLGSLERTLGLLPGMFKGVIAASVMLVPLTLLPLFPQATESVRQSVIGSRLVAAVSTAAPELMVRIPLLERTPFGGLGVTPGLPIPLPIAPGPQIADPDATYTLPPGDPGPLAPDPQAEEQMLTLLNQERVRAGLRPLVADEPLRQVARAHSQEMFVKGYFSHTSPTAGSPFDRMRAAGIRFLVAGENLAYAPSVQIAHDGLMNSPGHRANILRPEFARVGIGAIRSQFRGIMFSQEFAG